jgi:hypothetical protein
MHLIDITSSLTYTAIARYIGLQPCDKIGVATECPYCKANAWTIHQDSTNLEEWHYCAQCKVSGTVLAMAADRLNLSQEDAVQYLSDKLHNNLDIKAIRAFHHSLQLHDKFISFWEKVKKNLIYNRQEHIDIIEHLNWRFSTHMSIDRVNEGPASLFGVTSPKSSLKVFRKYFPIKDGPIAVVPFYKTPTRIGAFVCLNNKREVLIRPHAKTRTNDFGDVGFAGLQHLLSTESDTVVVTSMLQQMMQLQLHNFSSRHTPLPLLACRTVNTPRNQKQWTVLGDREIVIWEPYPTAAMLHQAMMTNARMTFVGPNEIRRKIGDVANSRWHAWVHHDPAIEVWRKIVNTSKPYEDALRNWLRIASTEQKNKLYKDAMSYSDAVAKLVRKVLSSKITTQLGRCITVPTKGQGSVAGSHGYTKIIEKDYKWFSLNGFVRMPAILRITHIVVRSNTPKEYIGYLQTANKKLNLRVFENQATMPWLRRFGIDNGIFMQADAYANIIRDRYTDNFDPFDAAFRLENPQIVVGLNKIGWDGTGFQLFNAKLFDGVFHQIPEFSFPENVPGPRQNACRLRDEVKFALKKENKEMEIVWAMACALCAQITAPAVGLQPIGICINRRDYDPIVQQLYKLFGIYKGPYTGWTHNWPRRLDAVGIAVKRDTTGFFVGQAYINTFKPNDLIVVRALDNELEPRKLTHSSDKIVLNYLKLFSTKSHKSPVDWASWVAYTCQQMRELFDFAPVDTLNNGLARVSLI